MGASPEASIRLKVMENEAEEEEVHTMVVEKELST